MSTADLPTIRLGTINDDPEDFAYLCRIYQETQRYENGFVLDFSDVVFLRQNAVAVLGGIILMAQRQGKQVTWIRSQWQNVTPNLRKNGFSELFPGEARFSFTGNAIKFTHYATYQDDAIICDFLERNWLQPRWINVSDMLKHRIVGNVAEIYTNAFTHAQSPIGVTSCGQHYPNKKLLKLTVADFGVGIPANVRTYLKNGTLADEEALRWAFTDGHTTATADHISRGMGLGMLERFVQLNQGMLEIYSDGAYVCIDKDGQRFTRREQTFHGTIVNITLNCDGVRYLLESENTPSDDSIF